MLQRRQACYVCPGTHACYVKNAAKDMEKGGRKGGGVGEERERQRERDVCLTLSPYDFLFLFVFVLFLSLFTVPKKATVVVFIYLYVAMIGSIMSICSRKCYYARARYANALMRTYSMQ